MSKKKQRLPTESVDEFGSNPFAELNSSGLSSLSSESIEGKKAKLTVSKTEKLGRISTSNNGLKFSVYSDGTVNKKMTLNF